MRRISVVAILVAVGLSGVGTVLAARQMVEIRLRGHFYPEPATVRMTVAVEPDGRNRLLRIEADGDAMYRATEIPLDGADEKRLHTVEFRSLSAGNYILRAEVHSSTSLVGQAMQELTVTRSGGR